LLIEICLMRIQVGSYLACHFSISSTTAHYWGYCSPSHFEGE
jgi:hypothetical protein